MQRIASALFGEGKPTRVFPDVCPTCKKLQKILRIAQVYTCEDCGKTGFCNLACFDAHQRLATCHFTHTPCHHSGPSACVRKSVFGACRGFAAGYVTKALLNGIVTAIAKRSPSKFFTAFRSNDPMRFGLFLGALAGVNGAMRCLLSHARGVDDRLSAAIAGFAAGLCIRLDDPSRARALGLYFLCRSLYLLLRIFMRMGYVPRIRNLSVWLFALANGPIMYSFLYFPKYLDKSYYKWILNMGNLTDGALKWSLRDSRAAIVEAAAQASDPATRHALLHEPFTEYNECFRRCDVEYHPGESCVTAHALDWFKCLMRGSKIYAPVHLAPVLLFKLASLRRQPLRAVKNTASAIAHSSAFISTYQYIVKMTMCILRHSRRRDDWWHAVLAGNLSALSLFWEQRKRRSELMLYCLPRGVEVVWRLLREAGFVSDVNNAGPIMFALAMAAMLAVSRKDLKPALQGLLWVLLGEPAHDLAPLKPEKVKKTVSPSLSQHANSAKK